MKATILFLAAAALLAFGAAQALGSSSSKTTLKTVTIAMHDPGCHWFMMGGTYKRALTVAGPIKLTNFDEAAVKIVGAGHVVREKVGAQLKLGRGTYAIAMVGQARDDNHLKLTVK